MKYILFIAILLPTFIYANKNWQPMEIPSQNDYQDSYGYQREAQADSWQKAFPNDTFNNSWNNHYMNDDPDNQFYENSYQNKYKFDFNIDDSGKIKSQWRDSEGRWNRDLENY
ncbi:hypothetical protein MNB_SUP05-5-916 [hydrothermal vent metagenome]|uniref:Uncharacterized protein n=1 Tax=hydrothermal vent metagenome TaxID=652676 RepID=A0A1W1C075_9ZZZZ